MTTLRFGRPICIAHRGASGYAPEHTFAAWDLALEMGADYLEQDLQMTRDGVLIVMHDATLDRTARGPLCVGPLIERTFDEIRSCDVGSWFNQKYPDRARPEFAEQRIPTLDDVLTRYAGRARFYIETKNPDEAPGMEQALVALLLRHGLLDDDAVGLPPVIVQSFSAESLRLLRFLVPAVPRVQLFGRMRARTLRSRLAEVADYAEGIGPSYRSVEAGVVRDAHERGLAVHPYTVNDVSDMRRLLDLGVDGIFTDYPDVFRGVGNGAGAGV